MNGNYFQPPVYPGTPMMPGTPAAPQVAPMMPGAPTAPQIAPMMPGMPATPLGAPMITGTPNQQMAPTITGQPVAGMEQSYVENILRANKGKLAKIFTSFPDSVDWRDRVFTGIVETAGRDHIILSDPKTGLWYIILMIYLNYIEFQEKINYPQEFEHFR